MRGRKGFIFQQDMAKSHTTNTVLAYLEATIHILFPPLYWPPISAGINPTGLQYLVYAKKYRIWREKFNTQTILNGRSVIVGRKTPKKLLTTQMIVFVLNFKRWSQWRALGLNSCRNRVHISCRNLKLRLLFFLKFKIVHGMSN